MARAPMRTEADRAREYDRITNRHIGKALNAITEVIDLPEIVAAAVEREMHRLKEDLQELAGRPLDG